MSQGSVFSPDHFNFYRENSLREFGDNPGINVGGYNRYADDTTLVSDSKKSHNTSSIL